MEDSYAIDLAYIAIDAVKETYYTLKSLQNSKCMSTKIIDQGKLIERELNKSLYRCACGCYGGYSYLYTCKHCGRAAVTFYDDVIVEGNLTGIEKVEIRE